VLFVLALRHLGAARTSAYYSTAPFIGAGLAVFILREPLTVQLIAAAILMGFGVLLHLIEVHEHDHLHEGVEHDHRHSHDTHHDHTHSQYDPPEETHSHQHRHPPMAHRHAHYPDIHHRHGHRD
jgi:ABC-type nickel/cobalt efflux system permease component RcnA